MVIKNKQMIHKKSLVYVPGFRRLRSSPTKYCPFLHLIACDCMNSVNHCYCPYMQVYLIEWIILIFIFEWNHYSYFLNQFLEENSFPAYQSFRLNFSNYVIHLNRAINHIRLFINDDHNIIRIISRKLPTTTYLKLNPFCFLFN